MNLEDSQGYYSLVKAIEDQVEEIDALPEYIDPRLLPTAIPTTARAFSVPEKKDNPLNAWSHRVRYQSRISLGNVNHSKLMT